MLGTNDVDDDFFTPVSGTSLANIFENVSKSTEATVNNSLKYVPPKPQSIPPKPEQIKTTECIYACALIGHEWFNNVYTSKGKLGFAIVRIQKTGDHNIILYDSNKTTLSCTTLSTLSEVTIKNNTYMSFYDNLKKYWSIYGTEEEIKKVVEHLTNLKVNIKYSTYTEQGPPEPTNPNNNPDVTLGQSDKNEKESDTDSSVNRKTKASILNRMANMGHSVLPIRALPGEKTSDSSDTTEIETQPKIRHKAGKSIVKRSNMDSTMHESQQLTETHQRFVMPKTESLENVSAYTTRNGQLLPLSSTSLISSPSTDFGLFVSEQRISNSELRINMNRITDKVDLVLDKINNLGHRENTVPTDNVILMKLLTEYENKIKVYEELIKSGGYKNNSEKFISPVVPSNDKEVEVLKNKLTELEKINQEKINELSIAQDEVRIWQNKHSEEKLSQANIIDELLKKVSNLEKKLTDKDEQLANMTEKLESLSSNMDNENIRDTVKTIMNDTFQNISQNFDSYENYSGETVKKIIGTVIKKITIQALNELL